MDPSLQNRLNERLFKSISRNEIKETKRLISAGADVNCEFSVEHMINLRLIDEKSVRLIKEAETSLEDQLPINEDTDKVSAIDRLLLTSACNDEPEKIPLRKSELIQLLKSECGIKFIMFRLSVSNLILSYKTCLSCLQLAVLYARKSIIVDLIRNGAFTNKKLDIQGLTILHLIFTRAVLNHDEECYAFDRNIFETLIEYGADPNQQDAAGRSALYYLLRDSEYFVRTLTKIRTKNGVTTTINRFTTKISLFSSFSEISHWILEMARLFLVNGANPNLVNDSNSRTVLFDIIVNEDFGEAQPELTYLFCDHAYVGETESNVKKQLEYLVPRDLEQVVKLRDAVRYQKLTSNRYEEINTDFIRSMWARNKMRVAKYLQAGKSGDVRNEEGFSALHVAVKAGDVGMVELLLNNGADVNIRGWKSGTTALFNAVISNNTKLATLLLKHGAKPDARSSSGLTPLYFSVTSAHHDMTSLLIAHKASPDVSSQLTLLIREAINLSSHKSTLKSSLDKIVNMYRYLKKQGIKPDYSLLYLLLNEVEEKCDKDSISQVRRVVTEIINAASQV